MGHSVGRGTALLFHDRGTRRGGWSAARPGRTLPPEKARYPLYRRLGGVLILPTQKFRPKLNKKYFFKIHIS